MRIAKWTAYRGGPWTAHRPRRRIERAAGKSEEPAGEAAKKIVLNMDSITFIDSAGLGTLVAAHHSAKSQGALRCASATSAQNSRKFANHEAAHRVRRVQIGSGSRSQLQIKFSGFGLKIWFIVKKFFDFVFF